MDWDCKGRHRSPAVTGADRCYPAAPIQCSKNTTSQHASATSATMHTRGVLQASKASGSRQVLRPLPRSYSAMPWFGTYMTSVFSNSYSTAFNHSHRPQPESSSSCQNAPQGLQSDNQQAQQTSNSVLDRDLIPTITPHQSNLSHKQYVLDQNDAFIDEIMGDTRAIKPHVMMRKEARSDPFTNGNMNSTATLTAGSAHAAESPALDDHDHFAPLARDPRSILTADGLYSDTPVPPMVPLRFPGTSFREGARERRDRDG